MQMKHRNPLKDVTVHGHNLHHAQVPLALQLLCCAGYSLLHMTAQPRSPSQILTVFFPV